MVVILMGVSGSGKTAVGQALAARLDWAFEDADDWHPASNVEKMRTGHPLTDEDRAPWLQSLNAAIQKWIAEHRNVVLACSALKRSYRQALRAGIANSDAVRFAYLRGTYQEIDHRLRDRHAHFMPESLLKSQFETLEEPDTSEAFAVDSSEPVRTLVDTIIRSLRLAALPQNPPAS